MKKKYVAVDLFSGSGGLSVGLKAAGFDIKIAIEKDPLAGACYKDNHPQTHLFLKDISLVEIKEVKKRLNGNRLDLLAGCPPCQGFSSIRRLNRKQAKRDKRNALLMQYLRFVKALKPVTIMMENVPALRNYYLFSEMLKKLKKLNYHIDYTIVNVSKYGVPQRRRRIVLVGSLLGPIKVAPPTFETVTVRQTIAKLPRPNKATDPLQKIMMKHSEKISRLIKLIPKNGGSRTDLPRKEQLACHKKEDVGFNDIYGRLKWDDVSGTITGGCLNPSKGRFLHPTQNRVITPREAALLQTFPMSYKFPANINKGKLALLIGNALPPRFSKIQVQNIAAHLKQHGY